METSSCKFYYTNTTSVHCCLFSQTFGFQCALCPQCTEAAERMNEVRGGGSSSDSGGQPVSDNVSESAAGV